MREQTGGKGAISSSAMDFRSSKEVSSRNQKSHCCVSAGTTKGGDPTKGLPRYVDINNDSRVQCAVELQLLWWMVGEGTARSKRGGPKEQVWCVQKTWLCQWKCSWIVSSRISLSGMGKQEQEKDFCGDRLGRGTSVVKGK